MPTLNLATEQELLPRDGVYATEAVVEGKTYRAATNVGVRPTFDGARRTVESHLFDFSEDLTSGKLEVRFFSSGCATNKSFQAPRSCGPRQVLRDIEQAKEYFREAASKTA